MQLPVPSVLPNPDSATPTAFYPAVAWIRDRLTCHLDALPITTEAPDCPPLTQLRRRFGLSDFEANVILLCAAMELDPHCLTLCGQIAGNPEQAYPTLALALQLFPNAAWDILAPQRPPLHWQLLKIDAQPTLTQARLRLDPRILCYLLGVPAFDMELTPWMHPLTAETLQLPPSHVAIATQIEQTWRAGRLAPVQLCSSDYKAQQAITKQLAQALGFEVYTVTAQTLPTQPQELYPLKQRWLREALLSRALLLINCHDLATSPAHQHAIAYFLQTLQAPVILCSSTQHHFGEQTVLTLDLPSLPHQEQQQLWTQYLGARAAELNGHLAPIVTQFNLGSHTIQAACASVQATPIEELPNQLWQYCRMQARPAIEHLAQRIDCTATWEDLILPPREKEILGAIADQVKQRSEVYQTWGFAGKSSRGLGVSALFAGPSGTGKTMAAEVLAREFQLDLYRIDLSAVSSKYIGETEKNLRQIFDAAESGGAVLLFDEADALFGKRTQVKDSHDRHANLEVSYLLQRMEAYQGLAILTTNLKDSLDQAFVRRLRFIVNFPYPNAEIRSQIWSRVFPAQAPINGLDFELLGQLDVAGGNIRAIALNAAFFAASAGESIQMKHLLKATQTEYAKIGRVLTSREIQDWV
ncbi:MAG: ATP-binding protein [Spirulina sp. SIO3F2]|nr:ATP-binding protein [Spirulina sp. SIO3F2]